MSDMTLSLRIQAETANVQKALSGLDRMMRQSAREANSANKESVISTQKRVEATESLTRSQKEMGTVGERAAKILKAELEKVNQASDRLQKTSVATGKEMVRSSQATTTKMADLKNEMGAAERKAGMLGTAWGKLTAVLLTFQGLAAAGGLLGMVEDMQRLEARLQVSEGSAKKAAIALAEIKSIAQTTGTPVNKVADAYVRFSGAISRVGGSQQQSVKFTESLTKALKNSGASAEQAGSVMLQLGQAFDSGRLSGDEFKSVAENGGKVLNYLASALGVTRGELRKMSEDGELTVDKLLRLTDAADEIDRDFSKMPKTVGDAITRIANAFVDMATKSSTLRVVLAALAVALEFIAKNLGKVLATGVVAIFGGWVVAVGGVSAAFNILAASIARVGVALSLVAKHPWIVAITAAITAIIWLWDDLAGAVEEFDETPMDKIQGEISEVERRLNGMQSKITPAMEKVKEAIDANRKAMSETAKAVSEAYAVMTAQVGSQASEQTRVVQQRYNEEKRLIGEVQGANDARYLAEAQALVTSTQEQLQIIRDAVSQKIGLLDEEYNLRKEVASRMVETDRERALALQNLENELLGKKREVLSQALNDYRQHVDALNTEAQRNLNEMRAIEEQKRQLSMGVEEKIRALRQSAMGEYQAYQDRIKQIDELTSKARQALASGDSKLAEEYAKKAIEASGQISRSVSQDGKEMVTQQQAVALAIEKITTAEQIAKQAMDARNTALSQANQTLQTQAEGVSQTMGQLATTLTIVNTQLSQGATYTITTNVEQVKADLKTLDDLIQQREVLLTVQSNIDEIKEKLESIKEKTSSEHGVEDNVPEVLEEIDKLKRRTSSIHTIYTRRVELDAAGGLVGGYASGGLIQRLAEGGRAFHRMVGRISGPGSGTSDSIPAMLSNGEFVIRAAMVKKFGADFFEALNRGFVPTIPKFSTGGAVSAPAAAGSFGDTMTWLIRAGETEAAIRVVGSDSRSNLHAITEELTRVGLLSGKR